MLLLYLQFTQALTLAWFYLKTHFLIIVINWIIFFDFSSQYSRYSYHHTRFADDSVSQITYFANIMYIIYMYLWVHDLRVLHHNHVKYWYQLFYTDFKVIWLDAFVCVIDELR